MVAAMLEAVPTWRGSTDSMMAVKFDEENKPKPTPITSVMMTIRVRDVPTSMIPAKKRPKVQKAMPMVAIRAGGKESASLPAMGANADCTKGCMMSSNPASLGEKPLAYCKYRLKKKIKLNEEAKLIKVAKLLKVNPRLSISR